MPSQISLSPTVEPPNARRNLIYFLVGNPGYISYYKKFLETLHELLGTSGSHEEASDIYYVYGRSLGGFEDDDGSTTGRSSPYGLEEQLERVVQSLIEQRIPSGPRKGEQFNNVILIGHSLGCYMSLEAMQRLKRRSPSSPRIAGAVLLFPTIMHLAKSPSGVKASNTIARIPEFPSLTTKLINGMLWPIPNWALSQLIRFVTGFPDDAADITLGFLRSRMGVWQALHLLRDELKMISEDKWDEDIWGLEHADGSEKANIPKLYFYFGQDDHWVANTTRDAIIAARGRLDGEDNSSKPVMMIDEVGMNHAFCMQYSETMAEKARVWINDIIESKR